MKEIKEMKALFDSFAKKADKFVEQNKQKNDK